MWKLDDIVMYGSAGICVIEDIRDEKFCDEIKKYYVLKPLFDDRNRFFIPSFNESLMAKIHSVMSCEEALCFIRTLPDISPSWIDNDKLRQEKYKEILESGERTSLISMLKALKSRQNELFEKGKRLRSLDEMYMRTGEALFENEIAHVFNITRQEVKQFIQAECKISIDK